MKESVLKRPAGRLLAQGYGWRAGRCWVGRASSREDRGSGPLVRCLVGWSSLGVPASFQAGKLSPGPPCQAARDIGMSSTAGHWESLPGPVVNSGNSCSTGS
jgi:hypothetical protein